MLTFNKQDFISLIEHTIPLKSQDYFYDVLAQENKKDFKNHSIATLSRFTNMVPSYQEDKEMFFNIVSVWKKIWKLSYKIAEDYVSDVQVSSLKSLVANIGTIIGSVLGFHLEISNQLSILISAYLLKFYMPSAQEPIAA